MVDFVSSFAIVNDSFAQLCKAGNCGMWECGNVGIKMRKKV